MVFRCIQKIASFYGRAEEQVFFALKIVWQNSCSLSSLTVACLFVYILISMSKHQRNMLRSKIRGLARYCKFEVNPGLVVYEAGSLFIEVDVYGNMPLAHGLLWTRLRSHLRSEHGTLTDQSREYSSLSSNSALCSGEREAGMWKHSEQRLESYFYCAHGFYKAATSCCKYSSAIFPPKKLCFFVGRVLIFLFTYFFP